MELPCIDDLPLRMVSGDAPCEVLERARTIGCVAWDIETGGLNWKTDQIATCQIFLPHEAVIIIRMTEQRPANLIELLEDPSIRKIFHHAMFDARVMSAGWSARPSHLACTKIASKILDRCETAEHRLQALVRRYCGVELPKELGRSNWFAPELTQEQLAYAARDVIYLPELLKAMEADLKKKGQLELARRCFDFIPVRIDLEIGEYGDVFTY